MPNPPTKESSPETEEWNVIRVHPRLYAELSLIRDEKKCNMDEALQAYIKRIIEKMTKTVESSCPKKHLPDGFYYPSCQLCGEMFKDILVLKGSDAEALVRDRRHRELCYDDDYGEAM